MKNMFLRFAKRGIEPDLPISTVEGMHGSPAEPTKLTCLG